MTNDTEDATGALQELLVAGGELDEAEKDRRRGRAPSRRGAFTPAPVWPDAAASGKSVTRQQAGASDGQETRRRNLVISMGPALVANSLCPGQEKCMMRRLDVQIGNAGSDVFSRSGRKPMIEIPAHSACERKP